MKDIARHRTILLNILKDIYQHPQLAAQLGFKGGTSLYFLHSLPRFSIDLDFDMLPGVQAISTEAMVSILQKYVSMKDSYEKQNTWFWLGSYAANQWNIKVEISKREFPNTYEIRDLYGLSVKTMSLNSQFTHTLVAITDRAEMVNRDLFDAWWFFKQATPIQAEIMLSRTSVSVPDYLQKLITYIPAHLSARGILDGLGELLDSELKTWAKDHLVKELLFYIKSWI